MRNADAACVTLESSKPIEDADVTYPASLFLPFPAAALPQAATTGPLAAVLAAALAAVLICVPAPLAPSEPAGASLPVFAAEVAVWVAEASGLPAPAQAPEVARASRHAMAVLHFGPAAATAGFASPVVALYDRTHRRILVAEDWTGATPVAVSVLVHEMVHHLQETAGVAYDCPAAREALAYEIQERWLQSFGLDLQSTFGINDLTRTLLTQCEG